MADFATSVEALPQGASLLDKKMKKSPTWISGVIVLVALVGGLAYVGFHLASDLGNITLGSVWPYLLLGTALLIALAFEFVNVTVIENASALERHSFRPNTSTCRALYWPGKDGKGEDPLGGHLDPSALPAQGRQQVQFDRRQPPGLQCGNPARDPLRLAFCSAILNGNGCVFRSHSLAARRARNLRHHLLYVNEQRREIAIRLALGAQRNNILKMVLRRGLALAATGAGIGVACALIVARLALDGLRTAGLCIGMRSLSRIKQS